ncbi:hypothetical protein FD754_019776 [Muntiacus muntjak]|uniref:Uncharacterized protein n=1 Tax=Muntiacus muntjak TaxID=9888 RepID=A0A5N3V2L4_MUNMU|nr:hypothetical protein FD754_019776 [Muntiacus muntjak]
MLCGTQVTEGVLGAPFLLEDPANQFLRLKRHIYLQDYWKPDHSPNTWGNTLVDQVTESVKTEPYSSIAFLSVFQEYLHANQNN